ncbi:Na+/H+ antiporter NhaA [Quadrisphaera sp. DSM 44207]|uniref:Na+/H+ antiporter NhaA n=1 Tax=Quadrisphaera sp. DSM 44207 TaxID=1881057 RepID=UPI00088947B4|nr:Na+/H+ antiporter NhaA [Quadrisphaera sp. DSM 44207]SDQ17890.1 sodium/proton antiporter, NhaA family [Quadrisphaera sp. DSM 44207]
MPSTPSRRLLPRPAEPWYVAELLRTETAGGLLLLGAAVVAMAWANSPWSGAYEALRELRVGPAALHLDLSLRAWAADGLLAVFFFVAGLELKREFVVGDLRSPARAALPVLAAVGGMVVPALLYVAVNLAAGGPLRGWAVPTATDIAFALGVLAVIGSALPGSLRAFLLTLAVVDDLLAIVVIAVFYTAELAWLPLLAALAPLTAFRLLMTRGVTRWYLLLPLAAAAWVLVHESGVHATIAGVALGLLVPVHLSGREGPQVAHDVEHAVRPFSAGVAVPVFALLAAGVSVSGGEGLSAALRDPVTLGVVAGLVAGKAVGIVGTTWLVSRFTRAELDPDLRWADLVGLGLLGGIGFTVSLLIGELAFGAGTPEDEHARLGVLVGSLASALLAAALLSARNRAYRRISAQEERDEDQDGVPDAWQRPSPDGAAPASAADPRPLPSDGVEGRDRPRRGQEAP